MPHGLIRGLPGLPGLRGWRSVVNEAKEKICAVDRVLCGILLSLRVVEAPGLGTLGVTRDGELLVDPKAVEELTLGYRRPEGLVRVLIHEALHVLFLHPKRCEKLRNMTLCNIAADAIVESVIDKTAVDRNLLVLGIYGVVGGRTVRHAPPPNSKYEKELEALKEFIRECGVAWELVPEYTLEELYERLERCIEARSPPRTIDVHPWKAGAAQAALSGEQRSTEGYGRDRLEEFARIASRMMSESGGTQGISGRLPGVAPGEVEKMLELLGVIVRVDWRQVLQKLLERLLPSDYTWLKPSRRSQSLGVYLPGVLKRGWKVAVVLDTSGSISDREYVEFLNAMWQLLAERPVETVIVAEADVSIRRIEVFTEPPPPAAVEWARRRLGYGGTRFDKPIEELLEKHPDLDLIVYFTDGYGVYPREPPPVPIVWVLAREGAEPGSKYYPPFGYVVRMA